MKTVAVILIAAAGFGLSGCGSGSGPRAPSTGPPGQGTTPQEPPHQGGMVSFIAPTTTTIANPQTGATMRCTNHGATVGAKVPAPGHGVGGAADGTSSSVMIKLTRRGNGSLVVSCTG